MEIAASISWVGRPVGNFSQTKKSCDLIGGSLVTTPCSNEDPNSPSNSLVLRRHGRLNDEKDDCLLSTSDVSRSFTSLRTLVVVSFPSRCILLKRYLYDSYPNKYRHGCVTAANYIMLRTLSLSTPYLMVSYMFGHTDARAGDRWWGKKFLLCDGIYDDRQLCAVRSWHCVLYWCHL